MSNAQTFNETLNQVDNYHGGIKADLSLKSGYELDIESGASLKLAGTAITATADELNKVYLQTSISDISGANSGFVVSPVAGTLSKVYTVIDGAITVGDAELTINVNGGTDVTETITIAYSGSAAGDVDSCVPADNNTVSVGDYIKITSDGGSTDACKAVVVFEITL